MLAKCAISTVGRGRAVQFRQSGFQSQYIRECTLADAWRRPIAAIAPLVPDTMYYQRSVVHARMSAQVVGERGRGGDVAIYVATTFFST